MTAVLSLTLAGAAHALSVDIVLPETDPAEVYPQVRVRFLAVAWDEKGNEVTDRATFTWTFPDAKEPTVGNPVLHRFPEVGKFLVSVSATVNSDSGCDETTVIVIPYEGGGLRSEPSEEDFTFTARYDEHVFGSEVCHEVALVVEQLPEHLLPFEWVVARFYRWENGQWVLKQNGSPYGRSASYGWSTTFDPNEEVRWRAHLELDEVAAEPPNTISFDLDESWTPNNTVVKASGDPLILHHADDTAHTIGWTITHCDDLDPVFAVTVTICDLAGNTVTTLTDPDAGVGAGSIVWNNNLPEENGIYTYKIQADHPEEPPLPYPCVDQDKSRALTISNVSVSDFTWSQTRYPDYAFVRLHYTLSRAASAVQVQCYKRDLTLTTIDDPETFPCTAGTHDVLVEFAVDRAIMGPYRFVISADETAADGAANRDGVAKPAHEKGATQVIWPPAQTCDGPGEALFYLTRLNIQAHQPHLLGDPDDVGQYAVGTCAANPADIAFWVRRSAVFTYCGHGETTFLDLDDTIYDLDDLASADLSNILFVMWLHCHSATPNNSYNFVDVSRAQGAECAVGWEGFVRNGCWPLFCDDFWSRTCRLDQDVDSALEDAVWQTWVTLGSWLTEGLFDYRCEGNVQLAPARYGH